MRHVAAISGEFSYFQWYSWRSGIVCKRASAAICMYVHEIGESQWHELVIFLRGLAPAICLPSIFAIQRSIFRMSIVPNEPILRAVCLSSFLHLLVIRFLFARARVKITAHIPLCVLINFLMFSRCSFTNNKKKILCYNIKCLIEIVQLFYENNFVTIL